MHRNILLLLFVIMCIALPLVSTAQEELQQNTQEDNINIPVEPNDVPIDGGLSLLIAAGGAYGIKKYRSYKNAGTAK